MIAEEFKSFNLPSISIEPGATISYIVQTIKAASNNFRTVINKRDIVKPLNENKLTQVLVQLIGAQLKSHDFLAVNSQYSDLFETKATGIPDFYFYMAEENNVHKAIFVVESKRLPSPNFETEYVKGEKLNGGIERFKIERHAKGFTNCGLVGFIELNEESFWLKTINSWIEELAKTDTNWYRDEILAKCEKESKYVYLKSNARIVSNKTDIVIHHIWVL